jgi:hypothetical protein
MKNIPHPGFENLKPEGVFQELACPACKNVPFDPIIPQCGHHHCRSCALKLDRCAGCPKEEATTAAWSPADWEDPSKPRHRGIKNTYDRVLVKCNACSQLVARGYKGDDFDQHVLVCPYACPLCGADSNRKQFEAHEKVCLKAEVRCRAEVYGCAWKGPRSESMQHESDCKSAQVTPALDGLLALVMPRVELAMSKSDAAIRRLDEMRDMRKNIDPLMVQMGALFTTYVQADAGDQDARKAAEAQLVKLCQEMHPVLKEVSSKLQE